MEPYKYYYMLQPYGGVAIRFAPPDADETRLYVGSNDYYPIGEYNLNIIKGQNGNYELYAYKAQPSPPPPPPEPDKEVLLNEKLKALDERNDFLEECIVEMANVIYNE